MRLLFTTLLLFCFTLSFAISYESEQIKSSLSPEKGENFTSIVVEVVDGDTVILENGVEVRLVGLQAPKIALGRKNFNE